MSVCIVGAGLSGLATAVRIKIQDRNIPVFVIQSPIKRSATLQAGMRIRTRKSGKGTEPADEIISLLSSRSGKKTPQIEEFAFLTLEEVKFWQTLNPGEFGVEIGNLQYEDKKEWFGPQWGIGKAKGKETLSWFEELARGLGVEFIELEIFQIRIKNGVAKSLVGKGRNGDSFLVESEVFILANGGMSGKLFNSTNVDIENSAHELLWKAGIPITDSTYHLIHPFCISNEQGVPLCGCYETDNLADYEVWVWDKNSQTYVRNPLIVISDGQKVQVEDLLKNHIAHYHFKEIARCFFDSGMPVRIVSCDGKTRYATVCHHYGHFSPKKEEDGVSIFGIKNLLAVGDAAGFGHILGHSVRLPGTALAWCLVSARKASNIICERYRSHNSESFRISLTADSEDHNKNYRCLERKIRDINTRYLFLLELSDNSRNKIEELCYEWIESLKRISEEGFSNNHILEISLSVAFANLKVRIGKENEPFEVSRETLEKARGGNFK